MAITRPREGGRTARVWEIADELTSATGQRARRKDVVDRVVAEGGKSNTASTQYDLWRRAQDEGEARARSGKVEPVFRPERAENNEAGAGSVNASSSNLPRGRPAPQPNPSPSPVRLNIGGDGRVVIPAEFRRAMQLDASGRVIARVEDGALSLLSPAVALRQAQALVAAFDRGQGSPVDELIRERRAEAEE